MNYFQQTCPFLFLKEENAKIIVNFLQRPKTYPNKSLSPDINIFMSFWLLFQILDSTKKYELSLGVLSEI
jgi:hypothetical protein